MNPLTTKHRLITSTAVAAALTLAAGCHTCNHQTAYAAPVTSTGGTGEEYQTTSGQEQYTGSGDVVIPLQREQPAVATQKVDEGAVRVRKIVKTETVNVPVTVRQETVSVDRVPAGGAQAGANTALNTPFQGGDITIPLMKEQPVASTQIVPNGSVVIHRQDTSQQVSVPTQVRSERVVAEPVGNAQNVNISQDLRPGANEQWQAQGAPPNAYGQSGGTSSGQSITQLNQLCNPSDTSSLYGSQVNISGVKVEQVLNDHLLMVKADNGTKFYVHSDQPFSGISTGQMVNLNGSIKQVPQDISTLGWEPETAQAIQGQQFVITCPSITAQQ